MQSILQDLRFGARALARNKAFTAVAVLTLALGIGANTAIFSVVNAVLLESVPYKAPGKLVFVWTTMISQGVPISGSAAPDFREWRAQSGLSGHGRLHLRQPEPLASRGGAVAFARSRRFAGTILASRREPRSGPHVPSRRRTVGTPPRRAIEL